MVDRRDIYHHCSCSYQIDCCIAHRDTETFRLGALKLHAIVFGSLSILTREEIGFLRMESLTSKQTWTSDYSKSSTIDCIISIICRDTNLVWDSATQSWTGHKSGTRNVYQFSNDCKSNFMTLLTFW